MSDVVVYLVGAGPGDAGLITVRGAELLSRADVIVHDYLANPALLDMAKPDARKHYVGKKGFSAHVTQQEINDLLVEEARVLRERGGGIVVRLKGGDPFVFGRGGEEALALTTAGVPFEVVPGVTSGVAAAAYAGIPVTHRGLSSTVTFVTGNEDPLKGKSAVNWEALAGLVQEGGTACLYMGMRNLPAIVKKLTESGVSPSVSAAAIQWGTLPKQRSVACSLKCIVAEVERAGLGAPAIVVIGAAAGLRDELSWFEQRPLFGKRIAVTRPRAQAQSLKSRLADLGADVVEFPTIHIASPCDGAPLEAALAGLASYDWIVFTSANGVDAFFSRLPGDARLLARAKIAAIGPATAARLHGCGIRADAVPAEYRGEALFESMRDVAAASGETLAGSHALVARAEQAREALPDLLRQAGATVDVVAAYRTVAPSGADAENLARELLAGRLDAMTFTSSSTVRNLMAMLGEQAAEMLDGVELFSIGPVTSATLRECGLPVTGEARDYTTAGLVEALVRHYAGQGEEPPSGSVAPTTRPEIGVRSCDVGKERAE